MRRIILFSAILILSLQLAKAQDKVYKKDGTMLEVNAVEQTSSLLKYKMSDYSDGPTLSMPLSKIEKIEYKNGYVDLAGNQNPRIGKPLSVNAGVVHAIESDGYFPQLKVGYFVSPWVEIEANITSDFEESVYVVAGPKFHLSSRYSTSPITPFVGLQFGTDTGVATTQLPIGVNYAGKKGLNISVSYNSITYWNDDLNSFSSVEVGVGWRF